MSDTQPEYVSYTGHNQTVLLSPFTEGCSGCDDVCVNYYGFPTPGESPVIYSQNYGHGLFHINVLVHHDRHIMLPVNVGPAMYTGAHYTSSCLACVCEDMNCLFL